MKYRRYMGSVTDVEYVDAYKNLTIEERRTLPESEKYSVDVLRKDGAGHYTNWWSKCVTRKGGVHAGS